jgi:predicted alpha/beta superfamily hydrolase
MSPDTKDHTLTGEFRTHARFRSRFLHHERTILVYLPPGYKARAARRYPVLYLQDGQNVFDKATSFGEEWHVDETAQSLIQNGQIEPLIVVGIYNTGEHRVDEYTPTKVADKGGGSADQYGRMIVEEIKPLIDRKYKTLPSAASTGLGGSSLGGLLTLHLALKYPTVFNRLAVLSPSVWWDNRVILREVESLSSKLPLKIWLDAGTGEGPDVVTDARSLRDVLLAKGWVADHDLRYVEAEGGQHNEQSWGARVGEVLKFLYPARRAGE